MASGNFFSILLFLKTISFTLADIPNLDYDTNLNFVPGTFAEYLPDPIFYDSYLPLIYKFPVPKHNENALKIMWQHATVCNESDSRYQGKLCPVVNHLHKIVANLSSDMGFWKDFIPQENKTTTKSTIVPNIAKNVPNCFEISPHFNSYHSTEEQLQNYIKQLQNCALGQNLQQIEQSNWIIDKQIYYTMVDRFYSEFYRTLPGTGNIDWVVTLNSYVTLQSVLLSNNYMESNRVMTAFLQCQSGLIPEQFVKPKMLKEALKNMESKVTSAHFKYLWDNEDLPSYYKLNIAECTFTDNYELIVRILIPVKVPDLDSKLLQIRTFPFIEHFQNIQSKFPKNDEKLSKNSKKFEEELSLQLCKLQGPSSLQLVESSFGLLFESNGCSPQKLCRRSDLNSYLPVDACISSLITNNDTLIKSNCHLNCFPIDQRALPIFQRKSSDTFLAIGTTDDKIFIQCNGQPLEKITLTNLGALEIQLSCDCQISYRKLVLQPVQPCTQDPSRVRHVLPLQWDIDVNLTNGDKGDINGVSQRENLILEALEKEEILELSKYYHYNVDKNENDINITNNTNHDGQADKQIYVEPESLSSGVLAQMCLLWILFVCLVASNGFLGYQVYKLLKWKQVQEYKDTRIVYSVPASPQFPNKF